MEKLQTKSSSKSVIATPKDSLDLYSAVEESNDLWEKALTLCLHPLAEQEHHLAIRPLEQQACIEALTQKSICWVSSDWGLGREGFIWSVLKGIENVQLPIYQISLSEYTSRDDFQSHFSITTGCSFPEFCKALAHIGSAFLLFDDIPTTNGDGKLPLIERDIEDLAKTIKDFCPEIVILLLSRTKPHQHIFTAINLEPLDEADTKSYIAAHPLSSSETNTTNAVNQIYRYTDGLPGKIDRTLRTLRVIPLSDLEPIHSIDSADYAASVETIPLSLVKAVTSLSHSKDPSSQRSYLLLKSLSILPQGESLDRLKRLDSKTPIFPKHAEELLDNDLIQVRSSSAFVGINNKNENLIKVLYAPRQVRDYVLLQMTSIEIDSLVKKAVNLYFGEKWRNGEASLKKVEEGVISNDGSLMENPHNLVIRLLKSSINENKAYSVSTILNLCKVYCQALYTGKHYRNSVAVCRNILSNVPPTELETIEALSLLLAKSLRMIGEHTDAIPIFEKLLENDLPKVKKINTLTEYAMSLQSLNDKKAIEVAKQVISIMPESSSAMQAKVILLEMEHDARPLKELLRVEKKARASGHNTVANNLALKRIEYTNVDDYKSLRTVYETSLKIGSQYNACRAAVKLAKLILKDTGSLPPNDLTNLIKSYQYFYGERFISLFTDAHIVLWDYFEKINDTKNLLTLFRHSSFIWRLNGNEEKERKYVQHLTSSARTLLSTNILTADKNTSYFLMRARNEKLGLEEDLVSRK